MGLRKMLFSPSISSSVESQVVGTILPLLVIFCLPTAIKSLMCGAPGRPANGAVTLYSSAFYNPGQSVNYNCLSGYTLLGNATRICQNDGTWSGAWPRCVPNIAYRKPVASSRVFNSYRPDMIVDGNIQSCIYMDQNIDDRFIQIDLGNNYMIDGLVVHVPDGYVQDWTIFVAEQRPSSPRIQYRRCMGQVSRISGLSQAIECRGDETGSPTSRGVLGRFLHIRDERKTHDFFFSLCEIEIYALQEGPSSCGMPDQPAFAFPPSQDQLVLAYQDTFEHELQCQTGFVLHGPKRMQCLEGTWIRNASHQCIAVECDPLTSFAHGYIDYFPIHGLGNLSFNTVAHHRCLEGYTVVDGDAIRTCGSDGRWTGTGPPSCRPIDCLLPLPIVNANYQLVDNHTKPGAIAQYSCVDGYVPQKIVPDKPLQTAVACQRNGQWKEGNFFCSLKTTYYLPPVSFPLRTPTEKHRVTFMKNGTPEGADSQQQMITPQDYVGNATIGEPFSVGAAIATSGFFVVFIVILIVSVATVLNIFRMRAVYDRLRKWAAFRLSRNRHIDLSVSAASESVHSGYNREAPANHVNFRVGAFSNELLELRCVVDGTTNDRSVGTIQCDPATPNSNDTVYFDITRPSFTETGAFDHFSIGHSLKFGDDYVTAVDPQKLVFGPDVCLYARVDLSQKIKNRTANISITETYNSESNAIGEKLCYSASEVPKFHEDGRLQLRLGDFHPKKVKSLTKTIFDVTFNDDSENVADSGAPEVEVQPLPPLFREKSQVVEELSGNDNKLYDTIP